MDASPQTLVAIPALSAVPIDQLQWLIDHSSVQEFKIDDYVFERGDAIDKMIIVLRGAFDVKIQRVDQYKTVAHIGKDEITGFLPYSRATTALAVAQCTAATTVLVTPRSCVREMTLRNYDLTEALVHLMLDRARQQATTSLMDEKLLALGKLSAGLAHELNNPASAMVSSAKVLKQQLGAVPDKFKRLMAVKSSPEEIEQINEVLFARLRDNKEAISLMERSNLEDEIADWLEDADVPNAYELAETLALFRFSQEDLDQIRLAAGSNFASAIEWVENVLTTESLVEEISEAAGRIAELIGNIKVYSHMDQSQDRMPVDLSKGIQSTVALMQHKARQKQVTIDLQIPVDFSQPTGIAGQLNQVWTNLLDNAIDAVDLGGDIRVVGQDMPGRIRISVIDNGSGIAPENITRIFEPFFTTKKVGEGTGLGLDASYKIVKQHQGEIEVSSTDEGTRFDVILPIEPTKS